MKNLNKEIPVYELFCNDKVDNVIKINLTDKPLFGEFVIINEKQKDEKSSK